MKHKASPYDLSTGDKGWPALVRSHKGQQRRLRKKEIERRKGKGPYEL